jgi:hypothetical protein
MCSTRRTVVNLRPTTPVSTAPLCTPLGRLWIAPPKERALPPAYGEIYGGALTIGARGGIKVEGTTERIPLEAE